MAQIKIPKSIPPIKIDRFLGVNDTPNGEVGMSLGEASYIRNWRVTRDYKLKKVEGYTKIIDGLTGKVQGMWNGRLNNTTYFLFCADGHLYSGNLTNGTKVDLGTLTDAPTRFIAFGSKVYLNNGHEYKSFNGVVATPSTNSLVTVAGYRPKIGIGTPPAGGGTPFEQINVLTGAKHQTFSGDGAATEYVIAEKAVDSIDFVKVNGTTLTLTTDYTVNLTDGKVIPVVPANFTVGEDNIDIGWTKGTGQRSFIEKCRFSMDYSGETDSRVFLWGNTDYKNRRFWSGLADGVPSAEYFESNSYSDEGNGQYAITDIIKQYDRQKIFMENGARYSYYALETIGNQTVVTFPSFELNESIGNVAEGQTQIVLNNAVTLYKGVYQWEASTVRDQTNAVPISQRVQESLNNVDLNQAITFNRQKQGELWINVDEIVWVFNYFNNTWYLFDDIEASCFIEIDDKFYFGTTGMINVFDIEERTHNGQPYTAKWESGFNAFNEEWLTKFMNYQYVGLYPELRSRVDVSVITDNEGLIDTQSIFYNLSTFEGMNFNHFSFDTSYNPQPKKIDIQANRFVYIKMILENSSSEETATVLSITLPARLGGRI